MTCWPKDKKDQGNYLLYNQANTDVPIEDRGPCKNLSSRNITAHLSVQQEVTVRCELHGNSGENPINVTVTLFPLNGELIDHKANC